MKTVLYILITWNVITFALYGIDKWRAKHRRWRIKESTLLLFAFLMGGVGAAAGMSIFRHKTKHIKFKILVPLALILNITAVIYCFYLADGKMPVF